MARFSRNRRRALVYLGVEAIRNSGGFLGLIIRYPTRIRYKAKTPGGVVRFGFGFENGWSGGSVRWLRSFARAVVAMDLSLAETFGYKSRRTRDGQQMCNGRKRSRIVLSLTRRKAHATSIRD
jgi:hypothetical protein